MRSAVIVAGSERVFWKAAAELRDYLQKESRLRYVVIAEGWNRDPGELASVIAFHAARAMRQPLLLAYIGHGSPHGWRYAVDGGQDLEFSYERLLGLLSWHRTGPTLVVNDCCHAGSLADPLARKGVSMPIGVIAACKAGAFSFGELVPTVIRTWRNRVTYVPQFRAIGRPNEQHVEELRLGPKLDRHFFPRKP